jgi:deoxyribose-phosphate aldolase
MQNLLPLLDLTRLVEQDDSEAIVILCQRALAAPMPVAAICVYPEWVALVRDELGDAPIAIATVINFPLGRAPVLELLETVFMSLNDGANELDLVIDYHKYLENQPSTTTNIVRQIKTIAGDVLVKVIIESGELTKPELIAKAAQEAIDGGADFVKTSTGKTSTGATLIAAEAILNVIKASTRPVGLKVSGGIRTVPQALEYIELGKRIMGDAFIGPERFRIGASALFDELTQS